MISRTTSFKGRRRFERLSGRQRAYELRTIDELLLLKTNKNG